ncbi:MAG: DUF5694 domain-containing protein [Myxococcota bacterium]
MNTTWYPALWLGFVVSACAAPTSTQPQPTSPSSQETIDVMVLGVYHFSNPGLDVHNIDAESVLSADRQRELEAVADGLAAFRPDRVMVEMSSDEEDLRLSQYDSFSDATLREDDNETVQIGFRLAKKLGLDTVYGIDEQPGPGEPDYFPFDRVAQTAKTSGQNSILEANHATASRSVDAFERQQKTASVSELLIEITRQVWLHA